MTSFSALTSSKNNNWLTPKIILGDVSGFFGGQIDLDPASDPYAQVFVNARRYYSPDRGQDGMQLDWTCSTMWLNPPYGQPNKAKGIYGAGAWLERLYRCYLEGKIGQAIALVRGDSEGIKKLMWNCYYIECDRIAFIDPDDFGRKSPVPNSKLIYLGSNELGFLRTFTKYGIPTRAEDLNLIFPEGLPQEFAGRQTPVTS